MRVLDGRTPERFFRTKNNWIGVGTENRRILVDFDQE